jgi:hypothetical protein
LNQIVAETVSCQNQIDSFFGNQRIALLIQAKQYGQTVWHHIPYGSLQTSPLASDARAGWIVFPSVGVAPPSYRWPGLSASPGKQNGAIPGPASICRIRLYCRFFLRFFLLACVKSQTCQSAAKQQEG